jgi:hypothetical protein
MAEFRTPHCFMPEWPRRLLELAVRVLVIVIRLFAEGGNALHCCTWFCPGRSPAARIGTVKRPEERIRDPPTMGATRERLTRAKHISTPHHEPRPPAQNVTVFATYVHRVRLFPFACYANGNPSPVITSHFFAASCHANVPRSCKRRTIQAEIVLPQIVLHPVLPWPWFWLMC